MNKMMENATTPGTSTPQYVAEPLGRKILMTTLSGLVQFLGIFGNLLVIISVARERRLKSNYYFLVMILAMCDLTLLLCSSFDHTIYPWTTGIAITSNIFCKIWEPLQFCLYLVECHLLCLIGVLRHRAVCRPFEPVLPRRKVKLLVFFNFVLSIILILPDVFSADLQNGICSEVWINRIPIQIYFIALFSYAFLLPTVVLAILYAKVCCTLFRHHREINIFSTNPNNGNERSSIRQARNIRVSIGCIIIVVVFVISSLPSTYGWFLLHYTETIENSHMQWLRLLYFAGVSGVNPFIYALSDRGLLLGYEKSLKTFLTRLMETLSYRPCWVTDVNRKNW